MRAIMMTLLAVVGLFFLSGCAGTQYREITELGDNYDYDLLQGGRTGVFGTDNSFGALIPKKTPPPAYRERSLTPEKVKLESTYTRNSLSWTNCPDEKPNPNAKNVRREKVKEQWTEEVVVAPAPEVMQYAPQPVFGFVGNPSAGNLTAPAVALAGGAVGAASARRPDKVNMVQKGGKMFQMQGQGQEQDAYANAEADSSSESGTETDIGIEIED